MAVIPAHYQAWLRPFSGGVSLQRRDCLTCEQSQLSIPLQERFSRETKCCTYFPFLPNFSVGLLLRNPSPNHSRDFARGRLTPLGLFPPPEFKRRREALGEAGFGRSEELLCPFFDRGAGSCSIWNQRPGVCASYFCPSSYGDRGLDLRKNIEAYLNLFEWTLAHETLWRLGFTQDDVRRMESAREAEIFDRRSAWAEEAGHEAAFFLRVADCAREVSREDVEALMGDEGLRLRARIQECGNTYPLGEMSLSRER